MKYNTIPAGYRLTVTSWENDGDNYNTKTLDGLTLEKVSYLVDLCKILGSSNAQIGNFGNLYDPSETEVLKLSKRIKAIIEKYPTIKADFFSMHTAEDGEESYPDYAAEELYELALVGGEFFTRVCESFVVEYVPQEIVIEDITDKFK